MEKVLNRLLLVIMMLTMATTFSACSDDDDNDLQVEEFSLVNTVWEYNSVFEENGVTIKESYQLSFSTKSAVYSLQLTLTQGNQTTTDRININYEYTYSDGLVILEPQEAGKAYLEGVITAGIKMRVINQSSGEEIGTFYKK